MTQFSNMKDIVQKGRKKRFIHGTSTKLRWAHFLGLIERSYSVYQIHIGRRDNKRETDFGPENNTFKLSTTETISRQ